MRRAAALFALLVMSTAALALAQSRVEVQGGRPSCVDVRAEARMQAYGWDHYVEVRNGCPQPMRCQVSTSVNPTPVAMSLAPGEAREAMMWRGSPASVFTANVECAAR